MTLTRKDEQKVIKRFAKEMQDKLDVRNYKGRMGWINQSVHLYLFRRLEEEVEELRQAIFKGKGDIKDEAVDVASYVMMINDVVGRKKL